MALRKGGWERKTLERGGGWVFKYSDGRQEGRGGTGLKKATSVWPPISRHPISPENEIGNQRGHQSTCPNNETASRRCCRLRKHLVTSGGAPGRKVTLFPQNFDFPARLVLLTSTFHSNALPFLPLHCRTPRPQDLWVLYQRSWEAGSPSWEHVHLERTQDTGRLCPGLLLRVP